MRQVLFVCTGNVFRSLTAEYALRAALNGRAGIAVAPAGTEDYAHSVMPEIRKHLLSRGLDVSAHRRRTLTQAMVEDALLDLHEAVLDYRTNRGAALAYLRETMDPSSSSRRGS